MAKFHELVVGVRFDRLRILRVVRMPLLPSEEIRGKAEGAWGAVCRCDCGVTVSVRGCRLGGVTKSCGCLKREVDTAKIVSDRVMRGGVAHGLSDHPSLYRWYNIKSRCFDPTNHNYHRYGGRGITVYVPWVSDVAAFVDWLDSNLGPCPDGYSLDRIDNNGNYEPGNLRWATWSEQMKNRNPFGRKNQNG
jgi:hypothetical protein